MDELDRRHEARDAFDTEVEDLTESLLSEEVPADANAEKIPPGNQNGPGTSSAHARLSQAGQRRQGIITNGIKLPDRRNINGRGSNSIDDAQDLEQEEDASDSDDAQPTDDPTVTFTPEQTAQVQDPARRPLRLVERSQDVTPSRPGLTNSKTIPYNDLYDVTGPSTLLRDDRHRQGPGQRLPRNNTAPVPARGSTSGGGSGGAVLSEAGVLQPVHPRPHTTAPLAKNRTQNQQPGNAAEEIGLFEPSDVMEEETENDNDNDPPLSEERDTSRPPPEPHPLSEPGQVNNATKPPSQQQPSSNQEGDKAQEEELDYPPSTLLSMPYSTLESESYDYIPSQTSTTTSSTSPIDPNPPSDPLPLRLQQIIPLPASDQKAFFNSLGLQDWEDSGDWFIEQFSVMMQRMKEARKNKRDVARRFEEEIAKRSGDVDSMRGGYEEVLGGMRRGGMGLLGREQ